MKSIADLMREVGKPAPAQGPRARPKVAAADMHPAHRENAIRKAIRDGDTARLAELQAATPKE